MRKPVSSVLVAEYQWLVSAFLTWLTHRILHAYPTVEDQRNAAETIVRNWPSCDNGLPRVFLAFGVLSKQEADALQLQPVNLAALLSRPDETLCLGPELLMGADEFGGAFARANFSHAQVVAYAARLRNALAGPDFLSGVTDIANDVRGMREDAILSLAHLE